MTGSARLICMSHLSDVQELNSFTMSKPAGEAGRIEEIRTKCNFVKWIIAKVDDMSQDIDPNQMWDEFKEAGY